MITGIPDEDVEFCPWCGEEIETRYSDGRCQCEKCKATFYVIEDEESKRGKEDE